MDQNDNVYNDMILNKMYKLKFLELWCDDCWNNETSLAQALAIYMGHLALYLHNKVHNLGSENHRCDIIFS